MSFGFGFGFPRSDTVAAGGVPGGGASLRLNFLDSTTLDPRVTFSRTSNATVFDNTGKLIYAPHNLLTNSESFDNVAWVKTSATIAANVAVAPDGTTTADTFTFAGAGGDQRATQGGVVPLGAICVFSVWLRGTAGQTVTIEIDTTAVVVVLTASWARYSVSGPSATTTAVCRVISRSGNTASVINVWGAQLNVANAPGVNLLTFSEEFDNAAWTKTNSSIQSNLLTFSEQFDNAVWTKTRSFIQTNQIRNNTMQGAVAGTPGTMPTNWTYFANGGLTTSVVGTGTQNGISYIDLRLNGTTSSTFAVLGLDVVGAAASAGQVWTESFWASLVSGSTANITSLNVNIRQTGGATPNFDTPFVPTASFTRVLGSGTLGTGATGVIPALALFFASGVAIDITLRIGWPQLVLGAVAGDPVPTYGAARAVMYSAPGGSITADKLSEDTQTGVHAAAQGVTVSAGALVTASVYIKAAERTQWLVILDDGTGINFAQIDHAGSVSSGGSASGVTGSVTAVGDGWSRFSVTCAPTASYTTARLRIAPLLSGSISYTGDGTSGIYIWGAQLVQGSEPYDYVRTDATPVAIGYSAPDATMTADKLVENTATSTHLVFSSALPVSAATVYTYSVYVKAAGRNWINMQIGTGTEAYGALVPFCFFDVSNETIGISGNATGTITAVGGGWYRCVLVAVPTTANTTTNVRIKTADSGVSDSYTGDGVSGVLIWGAQLNLGATALPYVETTNSIYPVPSYNDTTVQNLLGFTQEFDNAAWTKAASFIQTNLLSYSEQLDNATWAKVNSVIQTNQIRNNTMQGAVAGTPGTTPTNWATNLIGVSRQVVGSGIENGVSYIDIRFFGTPSSSADIQVLFEPNNGIAATNLTTYTESVFVALVGGSLANISAVRLAVGTYSAAAAFLEYLTGASISGSITSTMQRFSASVTTNNASTAFAQPVVGLSATSGQAVDFTIRIGWPQLVQGNAAGDPVATAGTALPVQYTAPDASVTAELMIGSPVTSVKNIFNQFSTTTTGPYTTSVYVKAGTENFVVIRVTDNTGANAARQRFNLATGAKDGAVVLEGTTTNGLSEITPVGNGWYRCSVTGTFTSALNLIQANFWLNSYASISLTTSLYFWGAQLVQGAVPGDYQETIATALPVQYVAPDGSVTAEKLVEDTAAGVEHRIGSVSIAWAGNGVYSTSFYVKAAGRFRFDILFGTAGNWVNGDPARVASFNLQTGTVTPAPLAPGVASIVDVGNGWYRCRITATATVAPSASGVFLRMADSTGSATYTGNGTDGILIWGAQISDSASLDPYVYNPAAASTSTAYYGPRFDYDPATLAARGLLIEEQRTNSIRNNTMVGAVAGTPGALPTNWSTFTSLTGLSREVVGTGIENGIAYIDVRVSGTPSAAAGYNFYTETATGVAALSGQTWTVSGFFKLQAGSLAGITSTRLFFQENNSIGGYLIEQNTAISAPTAASLVSQRSSATRTLTNASTAFLMPGFNLLLTGAAIDITLRIGLPQLELGAFATSVIPTTTAAATRTADNATMVGANFNNWYNASEGALFAEFTRGYTGNFANFTSPAIITSNVFGANANSIASVVTNGANQQLYNSMAVNNVEQLSYQQELAQITNKVALAYKTNDTQQFINSVAKTTDTSCTVPTSVSQMNIGTGAANVTFINSYIRRITYYPRRLSQAEGVGITL